MYRPRLALQTESPTDHGFHHFNGDNVVAGGGGVSDLPINSYPVHYGCQDFGLQYLLCWYLHDILGEDDEVRAFPRFDRAENFLGERGVSGIDRHSCGQTHARVGENEWETGVTHLEGLPTSSTSVLGTTRHAHEVSRLRRIAL